MMRIPARAHWNSPLGTWKPVKTAHAGGVKANRLRWFLLFLLVGAVFQLTGQQSEAEGKLLADIRTKAEKGDAQPQFELCNIFFFGNLGEPKDEPEAVQRFRKAAEQNSHKVYAMNEPLITPRKSR